MNVKLLISKIKRIWSNKWKISEGLWYNHVVFNVDPKHWAKRLVEDRRIQCYLCPHLDRDGSGPNAVVKGFPACGICGCNIVEKTASLSSDCALLEEGKEPRWRSVKVKNEAELEKYIDD